MSVVGDWAGDEWDELLIHSVGGWVSECTLQVLYRGTGARAHATGVSV